MRTEFTAEQLADPDLSRANKIIRDCVHCGMCTATCPTYQLLGDELDGPRGRIYLIKNMLEKGRPADKKTVMHIDRCLSCLACMTTCPSGVHYMHLLDHAREHIERTYRRPFSERIFRWLLARILPYPGRFRISILAAWAAKPFAFMLPRKLSAMVAFAPASLPPISPNDQPQEFAAKGEECMRVALMTGCAQKALNTDINDATIRLLTRSGCRVIIAKGAGCCGALTHHMGKTAESHRAATRNIHAWMALKRSDGLDRVVINASGCGTTVKDYGAMFANTELAEDAAKVAAMTLDITELMEQLQLTARAPRPLRVAYHAACSLQHGQQVKLAPKVLLSQAGFEVLEPEEAHLCCGSAGTYNLTQPEISAQLQARKVRHLEATEPEVIATGNIGCMMQISAVSGIPVVHTVELLDWASGGPVPPALRADR